MIWRKKTTLFILVLAVTCGHVQADYIFGEPVNLGPTVNSSAEEWGVSLSADGLSLYFSSKRAGGEGKNDIWVSTRATKEDAWGSPVNLGLPINSSAIEAYPCISADGLELYLNDHPFGALPGSLGMGDIWVARRTTVSDPWGSLVNLGSIINTSEADVSPCLSADGLSLYFASSWPKDTLSLDWDLYVTTRLTRSDPWLEPVNLGPTINGVNGTPLNYCPTISADERLFIFSSNRFGGSGGQDLWVTTRAMRDDPWSEAVNLGAAINSWKWEVEAEISPDGRSLLFCSNRYGGHGNYDIYEASIEPILDFNGDGHVDCLDICDLVAHWRTDDSLYDIGPMPWGDGIVDEKDLVVLAEHMVEISDANGL
ncbi:hypothetical protein ACFL3F_02000 [Planctomycetota bacterium]